MSIFTAIFGTHLINNLWPILHLSLVLPIILTIFLLDTNMKFRPISLILPTGIGIFLRLYTYAFPASMIGVDPDGFANDIQGILATGSTDIISGGFYQQAPSFFLLPAETGLIADIQATSAVAIYPVLSGILYPVVTFLLIRQLFNRKDTGEWYGFLGGTVASVAAVSVSLSYQPIAQTLGALLWLISLYLIVKYISNSSWQTSMIIIVIFLVSILYTHKLPLTFTLLIFSAVVFVVVFINIIPIKKAVNQHSVVIHNSVYIFSVVLILLAMQYFYATYFGSSVVSRLLGLSGPQTEAGLYSGPFQAAEAVPFGQEIEHVLTRRLHGFILIPIAGLSWLIVVVELLRRRIFNAGIIVVLTVAVVASVFMIIALVAPVSGGSVARYLLLSEPVLIALAVIAFQRRKHTIKWIMTLLIIAQLFSGIVIAPDHPDGGDRFLGTDGKEKYLSAQDIAAKNHGSGYAQDTIHSDWWAAGETTPQRINKYEPSGPSPRYEKFNDTAFLNGVLADEDYRYVLLRNQTVFRTDFGWYKITWRPSESYNRKYNKVYTNDDALIYSIHGG